MGKEKGEILMREILEQPSAIKESLSAVDLSELAHLFRKPLSRVILMGMGASFNAALYGQFLFSQLTHVRAQAYLSSDLLYYPPPISKEDLVIFVSQSGHTVETVRAATLLKESGFGRTLALTNTADSPLTKATGLSIVTRAGVERASSTKTYVSALAVLNLIAKAAANMLTDSKAYDYDPKQRLMLISDLLADKMGGWSEKIRSVVDVFKQASVRFLLARGFNLATAKTGSLLFKEAAKIWVEAYDAAEFRHEALELINERAAAIIIAAGPTEQVSRKLAVNMEKLGGTALVFTPMDLGFDERIDEDLTVFPFTTFLELAAHAMALSRGVDPDIFTAMSKVTLEE